PQPEVSVQEADTVTLDCTYSTSESNYYLLWYKQPPSGEMIFIIGQEAYKQQNATNSRYSVNFQKEAKSFRLRISDSQLEDAAKYFCAYSGPHPRLCWIRGPGSLRKNASTSRFRESCQHGRPRFAVGSRGLTYLGSSVAQMVTQPQPEVSVQEADTVTLDCTCSTSDSDYYLLWYKQPPSGEMIFIIGQEAYKQQNATNSHYSVNFQKEAKSFRLRISDSQLEDAAMYFCTYSGPQ
ncbi:hypothetical protein DBR06_SOUSAS14810108, partial [Sousa chinensis]